MRNSLSSHVTSSAFAAPRQEPGNISMPKTLSIILLHDSSRNEERFKTCGNTTIGLGRGTIGLGRGRAQSLDRW